MTIGVGAGRPPKPAAIHKLEGTYRPDRHKGDELFEVSKLVCPAWLDGAARRCWRDLAPLLAGAAVLTRGDRIALELLAKAYEEWRAADAAIAEFGGSLTYTTTTASGAEVRRPLPEVAIRQAAWHQVMAALGLFGLHPLSRAKIKKQAQEDEDPLGKFLPQRRAS